MARLTSAVSSTMSAMSRKADRAGLGRAVRERREALRISQGAAGISVSTWRTVEHAIDRPIGAPRCWASPRRCGWTPDSIDLVLAGCEPVPAGRAGSVSDGSDLRAAILAALDLSGHAGARTGTTQVSSMQRAVHLRAHLTVP
jgi:hypothetical protein